MTNFSNSTNEVLVVNAVRSNVVLTVISVIACIGFLCNFALLVILLGRQSMRNVSNLLVAGLASTYFIAASLVLPFSVISYAKQKWIFGEGFCSTQGFFTQLLYLASGQIVSVIALDRFYSIINPMGHATRVSERSVVCLLVFVWMQSALWSGLPIFGLRSMQYGYDPAKFTCALKWDVSGDLAVFLGFIALAEFILPAIVVIIMYSRVFLFARKSARQVRPGEIRLQVQEDGQFTSVPQQNNSNSAKAFSTLLVIVGTFLICRAPICVVNIMTIVNGKNHLDDKAYFATTWLLYYSTCIDPFVYSLLNRKIRSDLKNILLTCLGKGNEEEPDVVDFLRTITNSHVSPSTSRELEPPKLQTILTTTEISRSINTFTENISEETIQEDL